MRGFIKTTLACFWFSMFLGCKTPQASLPTSSESTSLENTRDNSNQNEEIETPRSQEPIIYRAAKSRIWDLLHTKLELSFDWENQYVNGVAQLELKPYFYPQEQLTLDAKGFDIHNIALVTKTGNADLTYSYNNEQLNITLDKEYTTEEKLLIEIKYTAKPNERSIGGSAAISSDKGLYFINPTGEDQNKPQQIWTQGETEANSAWFPTIDSPNERCTQEMFITVADRFKTLSNGSLIYSRSNDDGTRTDYWKMVEPHAPYLFMMAIGEFSVVKDKWRSTPLEYWVEPEYEEYADDIFGNTPEMVEYFSELLEYPYPWPKYSQVVVRDYVSGAMENTTASVFMEDLQITDRELLDENWDYIIAHELMHQWFGDLVTCESWSNLPLNEGFANYSEYLWNEYKYGIDEADYNGWVELQSYLAESETKQVPLIRYYYDDSEDMFDSHSYSKAGRVLHMLRKYVGDEAFFASLNDYLKSNAYNTVEIDDLRRSFEKITGEDLNWFFDQWFMMPGHPNLEVAHEYREDSVHLYIYQAQDTLTTPIYKLPVYLDIFQGEEIDRYPLIIEDAAEKYSFYYPEQPNLVLFDSEQQLLGAINHSKTALELYHQYTNAENFMSRYSALYEIQESFNDSLKNSVTKMALRDLSWRIRSDAIDMASENRQLEDPEVLASMIKLASDKKSMVRASALSVLVESDPEKYNDLIREGLRDSSFSVTGVALAAYLQNNADVDEQILSEFASSDNINVLIPVIDYYLATSDFSHYDWFNQKMKAMKGTDLYFFLQYYSQYLLAAPEDQKVNSVDILRKMAINHHQYYVRLGAFQGLSILFDLEGVPAIIEEIKKAENDPRLLEIYRQF